jgi:hypothetical protein
LEQDKEDAIICFAERIGNMSGATQLAEKLFEAN